MMTNENAPHGAKAEICLMERAEQIAKEATDESTLSDRPRCDPRVMAVGYLELRLAPVPPSVALPFFMPAATYRTISDLDPMNGAIFYEDTADEQREAFQVAIVVAGELLALAGWTFADEDERAEVECRVARALLLPREPYLRDVEAHGAGSPELLALWPLASLDVHGDRLHDLYGDRPVASLRDACPDLAQAVDAGFLLLPDVAIEGVRVEGRVLRFNPGLPAAERSARLLDVLERVRLVIAEVERGE